MESSGPDILVLNLNEDAWLGDAQFTVCIDGQQIGGTQTVTALANEGQTQAFKAYGNFATGLHTVTIDFLNDAYGGSALQDRNLYLTSASLNGATVAGAQLSEPSNGPQSVSFAGATAVATPTPAAVMLDTAATGPDILVLNLNEDAWLGDAQFTVCIDGQQIGGTQTVTALANEGQTQAFKAYGNFATGLHTVTIDFLNDAYGGSALQDRNLYLTSASLNGATVAGAQLSEPSNGPQSVSFVGAAAVATPTPAAVMLDTAATGPDILVLNLNEDAWLGDAQFTVCIDGQQIGGTQTVTALANEGQTQAFKAYGNFATGLHTVTIDFLNDAYGGSALQDRNLYLTSASLNGATVAGAQLSEPSNGPQSVSFAGAAAVATPTPAAVMLDTAATGPDILVLNLNEDAWLGDAQFTVCIDGQQIGGTQTVTALANEGQTQAFKAYGNFATGLHTVTIDFLNDAYGGSALQDRNLYLTSASLNGATVAGAQLSEPSNGPQSVSFVGAAAVATPTPAAVMLDTAATGPDILVLNLNEDAWLGDAQFTVCIDGQQIGGTQTVTALANEGQTQAFKAYGNFATGLHTVTIDFVNSDQLGPALQDRNLYLTSASLNGATVAGAQLSEPSNGPQSVSFVGAAAVATPTPAAVMLDTAATGPDILVLNLNEDAWLGDAQFTVCIDGQQIGGTQTVTALANEGQTQAFKAYGNFATGLHTVTIDFLNDAYGGSALQDRNLYLTSASLNGATVAGAQLSEPSNGPQSVSFSGTLPSSALQQSPIAYTYGPGQALNNLKVSNGSSILYVGNGASFWTGPGSQLLQNGDVGMMLSIPNLLLALSASSTLTIAAIAPWSTTSAESLSGSAAPSSTAFVVDTTTTGSSVVATCAVDETGRWSLTDVPILQPGLNTLTLIGAGPTPGSLAVSGAVSVSLADADPLSPTITSDAFLDDGCHDIRVFRGTGTPGSVVELGQQVGSKFEVIASATVSATGDWSWQMPVNSLQFGSNEISVRTLATNGSYSAWQNGLVVTVDDPEMTAVSVGTDLSSALRYDSQHGLDATADLQRLADEVSGSEPTILQIPAGKYILSSTVFLKSNTIVDGPGVSLVASDQWKLSSDPTTSATIRYAMFANAGWANAQVRDEGIEIRGVTFDWNGLNSPGSAAVRFINAQNVLVTGDVFVGSEDGTAFEGDTAAVVRNSTAYGTTNYAFDNWSGPNTTVIRDNTVYGASFGGIAITGLGNGQDANGQYDTVVGNSIYGSASYGVDVTTLSQTSSLSDILVSNNYIAGPGRGIEVVGNVANGDVVNNVITGSVSAPAIYVWNLPDYNGQLAEVSNALVEGNSISQAYTTSNAIGTVSVATNQGEVINNLFTNSITPAGVWIAGQNTLSADNSGIDTQNADYTATLFATASTVESGQAQLDDTGYSPEPDMSAWVTAVMNAGQGYGSYSPASEFSTDANGSLFSGAQPDSETAILLTSSASVVTFIGGTHTIYMTQSAEGAEIHGGSGSTQIVVLGGEGPDFTISDNETDISALKVLSSFPPISFIGANNLSGLQLWPSNTATTVQAGGTGQTIHPGIGSDTLLGSPMAGTTFAGTTQALGGDTIGNLLAGDSIDWTDLLPTAYIEFSPMSDHTTSLYVADGAVSGRLTLLGSYTAADFSIRPDQGHGTSILFQGH